MSNMNDINTKELGLFELFGTGWDIFRSNMSVFIKISFIVGLPISIILSYLNSIYAKVLTDIINTYGYDKIFDIMYSPEYIKNFSTLSIIMVAAQCIFMPLVIMAVADAAKDSLNGLNVSAKKSILNSVSKGGTVLLASIISTVLIFLGLSFFFIPGIVLYILFYFFAYTIIYEDANVFGSLFKSKKIAVSFGFKLPSYIIFVSLFRVILNNILSFLFGGLGVFLVGDVLVNILLICVYSYFICVSSVMYINRKALYLKKQNNMY